MLPASFLTESGLHVTDWHEPTPESQAMAHTVGRKQGAILIVRLKDISGVFSAC
jgi:hypothetical protein